LYRGQFKLWPQRIADLPSVMRAPMHADMLKQLPINMLWVLEDLSRLAWLSLTSFVKHGFRVKL
jgi:hypothetical protein